jgi:hypothetical protein
VRSDAGAIDVELRPVDISFKVEVVLQLAKDAI